jgi:hypothetical protein
VTLSPAGLIDIRITPDVIAWSAIDRISTRSYSRQKFLILALKPGEEAKLKLNPIQRLMRGPNALLGVNGLIIASQGLKTTQDALQIRLTAYFQRYGSGSSDKR